VDCILQWAIHIVPIASLHLEIWMLPICHYVPGAEDPSEM
jgi:hypothetical protein